MIVYLLLNTINNKGYVGKHKGSTISTRWREDLVGGNSHLEGARKRYGAGVFRREILNRCSSQDEMNNLERLWILTLRTYDPDYGYNKTFGGDGVRHTQETRAKMSRSHTGVKLGPHTPEHNKKIADSHRGKPTVLTPARIRANEALKGKPNLACKGKTIEEILGEERAAIVRQNQSKAKKGIHPSVTPESEKKRLEIM